MEFLRIYALVALVLGWGLAGCQAEPSVTSSTATELAATEPTKAAPATSGASASTPQGEAAARAEFAARMKTLDEKGDWKSILRSGREWQVSHSNDPTAYFSQANAAYMLGDVDASIAA
ncbi:hypothetical protein B1R32_108135 [Abditibacterium utsteinense]|uniref:Uncharacterized protein n=1 Tax=Abditibacterium utsteinense TaxID=1960156 RepID=A0A2S8SSY1_9BACT|nr:hypothetical protein [Abditibacterium utsteinense]PQV63924.1 hypothetical protein B1R32_108135 [Abditibacterium utsteinense]